MERLTIKVKAGNIAEQPVNLIVNSANGFLLMGSGTAEQIREAGGHLKTCRQFEAYWSLIGKATGELKPVLDYINSDKNSKRPVPSMIQKECLQYVIIDNKSKEFKSGDAILTSSGNLWMVPGMPKYVVHAIGMTYDWKVQPNPPIIKATKDTVERALTKSFEIANALECVSVAVPVMCTRKGGLSMEESTEATLKSLQVFDRSDSRVKEVIIVLYNDELAKEIGWFRNAYRR